MTDYAELMKLVRAAISDEDQHTRETDELLVAIERLVAEREDINKALEYWTSSDKRKRFPSGCACMVDENAEGIEGITQWCALHDSIRKDAERYTWLREHWGSFQTIYRDDQYVDGIERIELIDEYIWGGAGQKDLDVAIDAALREQEEKP